MFRAQDDSLYNPRNLFIWFLLAFQGGILNTGGYLAVHRFVSHVTGFATLAGIKGATFLWIDMWGMLLVPVFFVLGAILSAWSVERRRIKDQNPRYSLVFSIMLLNLLFIAIFGSLGYFGIFGEPFSYGRDYFLLFMLSFTCGLQNAVITSASGSVIRTTHLTGLSTDFGIGMVRIWTTRKNLHKQEVFASWCRLGIFISFFLGSLAAAFLFLKVQFFGFFLPVFISLFVAIRLRAIRKL
ncbi:MAG: YoaK family protein [Bacteriovorax sp.]|jgi:uncharacterized membrane protein YoaK (UPF0700 family)